MPMIRGLLPPIAVGVVARDGHRLFLCAAIFEPRHAPVDPGQAPIPPTPAWKRINCAHCSPFHLVVCSRHCHAMHARPVSTLEGISPHPRAPGPSTPTPQHPKSPPGQHPSHFQMTPGRRALFHRQRTGIHHPTSKDRPKKLPAPGSRLASSFHSCFRAVRCSTACTVVFAYTLQRDIDGRPLAVANSLSCPIEDSVLLP